VSDLPFWLALPLGVFLTLLAGALAMLVFALVLIVLTAIVDRMAGIK
jgi:hypothetical protein